MLARLSAFLILLFFFTGPPCFAKRADPLKKLERAEFDQACLFQNCGRGGPFRNVDAACASLKGKFAGGDVTQTGCRVVLQKGDKAMVFSLSYEAEDAMETQFLALRSDEGWRVVQEIQTMRSVGHSPYEDGSVDALQSMALIPGGGEQWQVSVGFSRQDESRSTGIVYLTSTKRTLFCGTDKDGPWCTAPIPNESVLTSARNNRNDSRSGYRLGMRFDPAKGRVTFANQWGDVPPKMEPFLGDHRIIDLPR